MAQDKMLKFLVEGLTRAFDKQEDCDVMFSVDGQTIGAHRLILNIHSQVLYEMAAGWTPDKDPIAIDDMSFDSFKALLRFMYSSETPVSNHSIFLFLSASICFKMELLEELCVDYIGNTLSNENICSFMEEAVNFNSTVLRKKCLELFSEQTTQIMEGTSFGKLSQPALSAFLDVDLTNVVEVILFLRVKEWMKNQCRDQGLAINGANMRQVIGDALYKIRFPTMNFQDFANSVTTIEEFLTESEMAHVFRKIAVLDNEGISCPFPNKFRCKINLCYIPFSDMEQLLNGNILYNGVSGNNDCRSVLNFVRRSPDGKDMCVPIHSLRFILQCCADLANSSPIAHITTPEDQATRTEFHDEFLAWQDIAKTQNVSDVMTKYMQLRKKADKLYKWYMYSNEITLSTETVFMFLSASTRFKMNYLEELSVGSITLGTENVCSYTEEALHFNSTALQRKCLEIFSKQTSQISIAHFTKLSQPALSCMLDVDETNMVEVALFRKIKLWMEQQCKDQGLPVNGANMRKVLGDALYKIRFPTMTVQDFANSVTTIKGLLTKYEIADIFQKMAVFDNEDIECPFPNKFRCKVNYHYIPFTDMENLLKEAIVYNGVSEQHCDCSTALKFAKEQPDNKDISMSVLSLRLILQCCADLANTSTAVYDTNSQNQATRNEIYDEFLAWQEIARTKNVTETMTKFMKLRTKLDKLYNWVY